MARNHHATALVVGDRGVLVEGASGSGKSQFAFALLAECRAAGRFACLVADDQLFLSSVHGRLVAAAPPAIAGLAEARGVGPRPIAYVAHAVVDLCVRFVSTADAPRYQEEIRCELAGVSLPCLRLPAGNLQSSVFATLAYLGMPPFTGRISDG